MVATLGLIINLNTVIFIAASFKGLKRDFCLYYSLLYALMINLFTTNAKWKKESKKSPYVSRAS